MRTRFSHDWAEFYTSFRGYLYFEWMRRQLIATELADVVLIDSRTGVTEMGGVCTRHLADVVVSMAAPNTQNLDGVALMAASFTREISDRKGRPLQVVMVPARIDTGEKDRRNRFESEFRQKLDEFTPATYKTVHTDFWQLRIPYIGAYAYEETLAIGRPDRDKDLEEAYKQVAAHLAILAPGKSALRQKSSVELERIFGKQLPRVFISSEGDQSESLAARLRARFEENGVSVWPTAPNPAAALSMLEQIKFLLLVLTSDSKNSSALISEYRVARQQGLDVLLISASGEFQPSPLMRNQPLYDADRDWDLILRTVQGPPKNVRVPFMAADVLPRYVSLENELARLKSEILSGENSGNNFVLWGPIGSGKTTLTIQLCNDDDVISAFDGGILWVDLDAYLGQPDIKAQIARLIVALTGDRSVTFVDDTDAAAYLTEKLGQRKCLMVIDEASDSRQVPPFLRGAPNCVRLITTRDSALAPAIGAKLIAIGDVSEDEAFKILAAQIKLSDEETHSLQRLVARLGRLLLVLKLANAQLKHRLELGGTVQSAVDEFERALQSANLLAFDVPGTNARDESASLSISASLAQLNDGERLRYLKLGYFPEHLAITAPEAARLWGEKEYDAERLLRRFADMALLQRDSTGAGFTLHPLLRSYILHEGGNQLGVDTKFEAAFAHLTEEEQQNARAIFTRLVRVARSNEGEDVAVKANTSVFNTNAPSILARLTEAGLIVASPQGDVEFADETAVKE